MPRSLLVVVALLILGATGFGAAQMIEARRLRTDAAALEKERADLRKRIWELQKRNAELQERQASAALPVPAEGTATGGPEPAGETFTVASADGPPVQFRARPGEFRRGLDIMNSPEVQQLMAVQQKAGLDGRYAALFRNLNLSPADLERFKELLVERQSAVMDVMSAARAQGLTGRDNRDDVRQLITQSQEEVDAMIRSQIGEAAYNQYKNYEATLPYRGTVDQLERRLSYSNTPLTNAQVEQVVQILSETSGNNGRGQRRTGEFLNVVMAGGPVGGAIMFGGPSISDDALARAQGVLTPQQLSALQGLQQEQQASQQLQQTLRDQRNAGRRERGGNTPGG